MNRNSLWTRWHSFGLLAIILAIASIGWFAPAQTRVLAWLATAFLLAIFALIAGHGIMGRWAGLLIDHRNKMSLSRFQMALWTFTILSALLIAALWNIKLESADPLAIAIPETLWLLMGISTTSLVGSPLIKSMREGKQPDVPQEAATFDLLAKQGVDAGQLDTNGLILTNTSPDQARWADMFRGEETGNAAQLDLAKIQLFYFTLVLVFAYAMAIADVFAGAAAILSLPDLAPGLIALIGISHTGYLANKAMPHSQTA